MCCPFVGGSAAHVDQPLPQGALIRERGPLESTSDGSGLSRQVFDHGMGK
jgi:hypothetical protein